MDRQFQSIILRVVTDYILLAFSVEYNRISGFTHSLDKLDNPPIIVTSIAGIGIVVEERQQRETADEHQPGPPQQIASPVVFQSRRQVNRCQG